jgi:histone-lysine N-methyltransferase SETMAR
VVSKIFRTGAAIYTAVVVAQRIIPKGQTVNSGFYCDVFRRKRENVRRRRPELWKEQTWLLHHDKIPSHTSVQTQQFLAEQKMAVIPHPPYSPDSAPCDFFLFPKMKLKLKGRRFDTIEEIQAESQRVIDTVKD